MQEQTLMIQNKLGLHARAAIKLIQLASRFQSHIQLDCHGRKIDGKDILQVMALGAACGKSITIFSEGPDEVDAMTALSALINDKFGED